LANTKPTLIGVAHDIQEVSALPIAPWDIPLDAIVTPTKILHF
ncbi:MAG: 5-formyltetrahydrofolate cyclo-ligase, partial [Pseudomonadota bacterium]|nr:5-formyltetrahydrofolate cyclo-ligase [Pseudomonadota bacterium]